MNPNDLWQVVVAALGTFWADGRTQAIVGLIALNLITGVMAALVTRTFSFKALGDFFSTRVLPFVVGYLAVYIFGAVLGATMPPAVRDVLQAIDQWAGAGIAIVNLLAAIAANLSVFRPAPPPGP